ncbi:MAG: hypothetical protein V1792_19360 [Pseudomonadota bacterium]
MPRKVRFSLQHQDSAQIALHHSDLTEALKGYFKASYGSYPERFVGYTPKELAEELQARLDEIDRASVFSLLSAVEAAFRIDYLQRCQAKKKKREDISQELRSIYEEKGTRASFKDHILPAWKREPTIRAGLISDLIAAFRYRDWLAHGRYWTAKLGRKYDYESVYKLVEDILDSFPFVEADAE